MYHTNQKPQTTTSQLSQARVKPLHRSEHPEEQTAVMGTGLLQGRELGYSQLLDHYLEASQLNTLSSPCHLLVYPTTIKKYSDLFPTTFLNTYSPKVLQQVTQKLEMSTHIYILKASFLQGEDIFYMEEDIALHNRCSGPQGSAALALFSKISLMHILPGRRAA